jgi:hypothetical protein
VLAHAHVIQGEPDIMQFVDSEINQGHSSVASGCPMGIKGLADRLSSELAMVMPDKGTCNLKGMNIH